MRHCWRRWGRRITKTDPVTGEDVEDRVARFPVLSVFDISQTDGEPIPGTTYTLPTGAGPDRALDRLTGWLHAEGWTVREQPWPAAWRATPTTPAT